MSDESNTPTPTARYYVAARYWTDELQSRFGDKGTFHELTDAEVIAAIRQFGRAEIRTEKNRVWNKELNRWCESADVYVIDFHNEYD